MNELVLKEFSGVPEVTPGAFELKTRALELCKPIRVVTTPDEQTKAVAALREVKAVLNGMESTRKAVKRPVLDLGKRIDDLAHGFTQELEKQYGRLSGMINHYQRKQLQAKAEEVGKIKSNEMLAAELREKAAILRDDANVAGDLPHHEAMMREADKLESQAFDLEMSTELAVVSGVDKPPGLVVRNRINFEVIDPIVFCQAYPQFFKWRKDDETLKVDRMGVLDELNREDQRGIFHRTRFPEELSQTEDRRLVQPAGLRVYEETKAHIR
jgi:hypothetical protein